LYVSYLLYPRGSKATDMKGMSNANGRNQDLWGRRNLSIAKGEVVTPILRYIPIILT
jgi:hypothetical protein